MTRIDENPYKVTTRKRTVPTGFKPWQVGVRYVGTARTPTRYSFSGEELCDAQITVSEGHPFWSQIKDQKGISKPDMGGDFLTQKWECIVDKTVYSSSYKDTSSAQRLWESSGHCIPSVRDTYNSASLGWGYITKNTDPSDLLLKYPTYHDSDDQLAAYGTHAIAQTRPDVSPASVTQFLVELHRDGIPFLAKLNKTEFDRILRGFKEHGTGVGSSKKGSDYFLENQFGLKPFVSDLYAFKKVAVDGVSVLDNLIANDGKLIRRSYRWPHESFSKVQGHAASPLLFGMSAVGSQYFTSGGAAPVSATSQSVQTERDTWFSGAYRIFMPKDNEPVSRLKAVADRIRWDYGLDLDFITLWNLAPWSWLIDWQLNLGDVITNFSKWSDDAVVLQYGYVMQKTSTTYEIPMADSFIEGTAPSRNVPSMVLKTTRKRRVRATPYGFGKTFGSLNANQLSILAAIGITRF